MADVTFSKAAEADLVDIDDYSVAQFGEDTADLYMRGFNEAFARLRDFPETGRPVPEPGTGIRCLTHRRHRISYAFTDDRAFVVRIVHDGMDAKRALEGAGAP